MRVTKAVLVKRLDLIAQLFLAAASAAQNASDAVKLGRPWRTDDLEDGYTDAVRAAKLLSELL